MATAPMVTVEIDGERLRLPTHIAAEKMVKAYGERVYDQEIVGLKSAFFRFWGEVDEGLACAIGQQALRERLLAVVGEDRIPAEEMMFLIREYGPGGES